MSKQEKEKTVDSMLDEGYSMEEIYNQDIVDREFYSPSGTMEYYDGNNWYNSFGQRLIKPSEYLSKNECYTPFGDE